MWRVRSLHLARLPTPPPRALTEPHRHRSFYDLIHSSTLLRMGGEGGAAPARSKDIMKHHMPGIGFDPVASFDAMSRLRGRLRRTHGLHTDPASQFSVEETARWMDVAAAARVLELSPQSLPTLSRAAVETRWREVYTARPAGQSREEALIAAEVLLDYVDSTLQRRASRAHYRAHMERARDAVEGELHAQGAWMRWVLPVYGMAWAMLGMCVVVVVVAALRAHASRRDFAAIGDRAKDYLTVTFLKSTNLEPAPDYATRYMLTPTAQELAQRSARMNVGAGLGGAKGTDGVGEAQDWVVRDSFSDGHTARLLQQSRAYEEAENEEMVKLWNAESAAAAARERVTRLERSRLVAATGAAATRSSSSAELAPSKGSLDSEEHALTGASGDGARQTSAPEWNFRDFWTLMANNFGGGSRFQRITNDSTVRAGEMRVMEERATHWDAEEHAQQIRR